MKQLSTYDMSLKFIVIMALVGVLFSNSISYYSWLFETDHVSYKICDPLDGETEHEPENAEENINDKVPTYDFDFNTVSSHPLENTDYIKFCQSIHQLDIPTPPPREIS